jgi:hypothetical protein
MTPSFKNQCARMPGGECTTRGSPNGICSRLMTARAKRLPAALVARVDQILEQYELRALDAFLREPGAREALEHCDAIARVATYHTDLDLSESTRLNFLQRLLGLEADLNRTGPRHPTPFAAIVGSSWLSGPHKLKLIARLLDQADPNIASGMYRTSAIDAAVSSHAHEPRVLRALAGKATRDGWLNGLILALERHDQQPETFEAVLGWLTGDASGTGRRGLAAVHVAAVYCPPEVLTRILKCTRDPAVVTSTAGEVGVREGVPPSGGLVPTVAYEAGLTAIELLDRVLELAAGTLTEFGKRLDPEDRSRRAASLERRSACRERLLAAGLVGRPVAPQVIPAFKPAIDALFRQLASLADLDPAAVQADLDRIRLSDLGPWSYFTAAVETLEQFFTHDAVLAWLPEGTLFRRLVAQQAFRGQDQRALATEGPAEDDHPLFRWVPIDDYPRAARVGLRQGNFIAADSDSGELHFLWSGPARKDGSVRTRVCRADFETFEALATSVEAFLTSQLDAALNTR